MKRFAHGHATHPDWRMALALAAAQVDAQLGAAPRDAAAAGQPTLGWLYFTDHYAPQAVALLADVQKRWPGVAWVGGVGVGVAASGVEYFDEPALVLMLAELPAAQFRVFSGARPLGDFAAHTAQVHADPGTAELAELITDMSDRTATGYLFGGLASARTNTLHIAGEVLHGGLSGVAFTRAVALVSRVTQGCQPVGPQRRVSEVDRNVVTALDGEPALDCLLRDLGVSGNEPGQRCPGCGKHSSACPTRAMPPPTARATRPCSVVPSAPTCGCAIWSAWTRRAAASRLPTTPKSVCNSRSAPATRKRRAATWFASAAKSATRSNPKPCRWRRPSR
jgi:FIST N domain